MVGICMVPEILDEKQASQCIIIKTSTSRRKSHQWTDEDSVLALARFSAKDFILADASAFRQPLLGELMKMRGFYEAWKARTQLNQSDNLHALSRVIMT